MLYHYCVSTDTPSIVISPSDTEVLQGDTFPIICVAYDVTFPTIQWMKNGSEVVNDSHTTIRSDTVEDVGSIFARSILKMCKTDLKDAGEHSCVASNVYGENTTDFHLNVTSENATLH